MKSLAVGEVAPEITFNLYDGRKISLSDFRGQVVVLFFYPADNTLLCTREACSFRDAFPDFRQAGAVVIGVSSDAEGTHTSFAASNQLPYLIASDTDGAVRRAFGVRKRWGVLPGRVTYVIDRNGVIRDIFESQILAKKHADNALHIVRTLASQRQAHP